MFPSRKVFSTKESVLQIVSFNKMGLRLSRPECNVPVRFLIGIDNSRSILRACAWQQVVFMWGFLLVITIAILIAYLLSRNNAANTFHVPFWLLFVPPAFGIIYQARMSFNLSNDLAAERIEYQLSGMSKKDYINYKVGDDRTAKSFAASATSAGILSATNIAGPFLRGDK
jgi:hypothetical protein